MPLEESQVTLAQEVRTVINAIHDRYNVQYSVIAALMDENPTTMYQLRTGRVSSIAKSRDYLRRLNKVVQIVVGCERFLRENRTRNRSGSITFEILANYLHHVYVQATDDAIKDEQASQAEMAEERRKKARHAASQRSRKLKIEGAPPSPTPGMEERAVRIRQAMEERARGLEPEKKKLRTTNGVVVT